MVFLNPEKFLPVQNTVEMTKTVLDNYSTTNYVPSSFLNYFVLSANFETTNSVQLLQALPFFNKFNSKFLLNSHSFNNVFLLNDIFSVSRLNAFDLSNPVISKTLRFAGVDGFYSFSFLNSLEYVFNIKSLEYNYSSIVLSILFFAFFLFFIFLFWFTLFTPTPQQLYPNEAFLLSLDSSYGLVEAEKEVGALDDILLPLFFTLIASVVWFYLLLPIQVLTTVNAYLDGFLMLFFCCIIVSLPINLLYECGFFFSTFFRGSAGSTSTLMELVYDLIANTTMFARMQVQHVRVLLGLAMYVETTNYIETLSFNQLLSQPGLNAYTTYFNTNEHFTSSGISFVSDIILQISTLIGEFGHYIVFLLQSSASYAALIFWLFSLLYSGFFKDTIENYFTVKESLKH